MADKKITALTALTADGKVAADDLLHIIDFSASPVNKKISVANLFEKVNCVISSYGAFTHDFGASAGASGLSVVIPNATPAASAETEVVVNDDGNAFVDFRVETGLSASALKVDSSLDTDNGSCNTVTINGDFAKVDFRVNSDTSTATTPLIHCDSTDHAIGIGKEDPDTAYLMDIADVSGKSIKASGTIDATGVVTATGGLTVGGLVKLNQAQGAVVVGTADGTVGGVIPLTTTVSYLSACAGGADNDKFDLADGVTGQLKICILTTIANSATAKITPTNFDGNRIELNAVGETAVLMFHGSKWYLIGHHYGTVVS